MVQEARDSNNARLDAFEQEVKRAAAAAAATVQAEFDDMHKRKKAQMQAMHDLENKYRADLTAAWTKYKEIHAEGPAIRQARPLCALLSPHAWIEPNQQLINAAVIGRVLHACSSLGADAFKVTDLVA